VYVCAVGNCATTATVVALMRSQTRQQQKQQQQAHTEKIHLYLQAGMSHVVCLGEKRINRNSNKLKEMQGNPHLTLSLALALIHVARCTLLVARTSGDSCNSHEETK